MSQVAAPNTF